MEHCIKTFDELTNVELFKIYKERVAIFVVEQHCPYQEVDDIDLISLHHFFMDEGKIAAYDRVYLMDGRVHIGRVIVNEAYRKSGMGLRLLEATMAVIEERYPGMTVEIGAQAHLQGFYGKVGFVRDSEVYLEDGIAHVRMVR